MLLLLLFGGRQPPLSRSGLHWAASGGHLEARDSHEPCSGGIGVRGFSLHPDLVQGCLGFFPKQSTVEVLDSFKDCRHSEGCCWVHWAPCLPLSPFVSLCLPLSPFVSLCLPLSPFVSLYLPLSSLCLPLSPFASLCLPLSPRPLFGVFGGVIRTFRV